MTFSLNLCLLAIGEFPSASAWSLLSWITGPDVRRDGGMDLIPPPPIHRRRGMGRDHLVFQGQKEGRRRRRKRKRRSVFERKRRGGGKDIRIRAPNLELLPPPFLDRQGCAADRRPTDPRFRSASNFILSFFLEQIRGGDDVFS